MISTLSSSPPMMVNMANELEFVILANDFSCEAVERATKKLNDFSIEAV
jgi:hypothetical protein